MLTLLGNIDLRGENGEIIWNICEIMYTQQDFELIFTDSRVNNIGIWIKNSSQIRVGEDYRVIE